MLVLKGKANLKIKDEKGKDARECVPPVGSTLRHTAPTPSLRTRSCAAAAAFCSYAALRKNDKIMAFLDNPKATAADDDEGDEDEEEKPKARVFKASQQVGGMGRQPVMHRATACSTPGLVWGLRCVAVGARLVGPDGNRRRRVRHGGGA